VTIFTQVPKTVRWEQGFTGMRPVQKTELREGINNKEISFEFTGTGFVLKGETEKIKPDSPDYTFDEEVWIDGKKTEVVKLPTNYTTRRQELCWKYQLPVGKHSIRVKVLNPDPGYRLNSDEYLTYK
jgi:hypothetical protein